MPKTVPPKGTTIETPKTNAPGVRKTPRGTRAGKNVRRTPVGNKHLQASAEWAELDSHPATSPRSATAGYTTGRMAAAADCPAAEFALSLIHI